MGPQRLSLCRYDCWSEINFVAEFAQLSDQSRSALPLGVEGKRAAIDITHCHTLLPSPLERDG